MTTPDLDATTWLALEFLNEALDTIEREDLARPAPAGETTRAASRSAGCGGTRLGSQTAGGGVNPPTLPPVQPGGWGAVSTARVPPSHQTPAAPARASTEVNSGTRPGSGGQGRLVWLKRAALVPLAIIAAALVLAAAFAIGGGIFLLAAMWWPQ